MKYAVRVRGLTGPSGRHQGDNFIVTPRTADMGQGRSEAVPFAAAFAAPATPVTEGGGRATVPWCCGDDQSGLVPKCRRPTNGVCAV